MINIFVNHSLLKLSILPFLEVINLDHLWGTKLKFEHYMKIYLLLHFVTIVMMINYINVIISRQPMRTMYHIALPYLYTSTVHSGMWSCDPLYIMFLYHVILIGISKQRNLIYQPFILILLLILCISHHYVCVCLSVCVYVCVYICVWARVCVSVCIHTYICVSIVHTQMCVYIACVMYFSA